MPTIYFNTGHDDKAGTLPTGQPMPDRTQNEHYYAQQSTFPYATQHNDSANVHHLPAVTPFKAFVCQLNLEPRHTEALYNAISSGDLELLGAIVNLSLCDDAAYSESRSLSYRGRTMSHIRDLVPRLVSTPEPIWQMLNAVGSDRRHMLAFHLQQLDHGFQNFRQDAMIRKKSAGQALSPSSAAFSSASPSSPGVNPRTPSQYRYYCPAVDCVHKLKGYTRWGYLHNHIKTVHPSILDEYDSESKVDVRREGDTSPSRSGNGRHGKRAATPSTPGERAHKQMLLGMDATDVKGNYSPQNLNKDLDESAQISVPGRYDDGPARKLQQTMSTPNITDMDYLETTFDFNNAAATNPGNLQPPTIPNLDLSHPERSPTGTLIETSTPLLYAEYQPFPANIWLLRVQSNAVSAIQTTMISASVSDLVSHLDQTRGR